MDNFQFIVDESSVNSRLDVFLSLKLEDKSRAFIQGIIEKNYVKVNGVLKKSNYKIKLGDCIEVFIDKPMELNIKAENIQLNVLYEDKDIIVVNKPQGMIVHPASGVNSNTLVNALLAHCKDLSGINGVMRPGIVHRIDKDTSGVLVVAKNDFAHNNLAYQLKEHSMNREYIALVEGNIKSDTGTIDKPLGRHPSQRIKMAIVKDGKKAVTHYKVITRYNGFTLVKCILETGRTHQIRVHMASIGHPLVGDPVYGYKKQRFNLNGQLLHAEKLGFIHPVMKDYMEFSAPIPDYFKNIIENLSKSGGNL